MIQAAIHQTVDHLFRHESGKMIAVLSKLLGLQHLDAAQDIVQDTLLQALNTWSLNGMPDNPAAWLHRVARNKAIDYLRRDKSFRERSPQYGYLQQSDASLTPVFDGLFEEDAIEDSQLRMIFACCHPSIPVESQIALALKTLCGLSVSEIAKAFLKDEEAIAKRIYRAKEKIRSEKIELELPPSAHLQKRLDSVLHCLYLLFNEGYNSSHPDQLIREDLCEEAMRLAYMLSKNPLTCLPRTNAMLALFCFQASRLQSRLDGGGNIILLKHQDRTKWFRPLIQKGFELLEGATGKEITVYHLEAGIAYLHAKARSFEATDWKTIRHLYSLLLAYHPTPFIQLNRAIATSYAVDHHTALIELTEIKGLENYYLFHTAMGEIHFGLNQMADALTAYEKAFTLAPTHIEKKLLIVKMHNCKRAATSKKS